MTSRPAPADPESAEHIAFEDFRNGLPHGRFSIIVNPAMAYPFVAGRMHATAVAIALIGPGIACALSGYAVVGALLVAAGVFLRRSVKWRAAKILLHLVTHQAGAYYDATTQGVMEVRRN